MTLIHPDSEVTIPTMPLPQAHDSLGQWLRRARLARGFEPRDVAQRLRINVAIIEALEADDPSRYPEAPVFMRGHLQRLARLLGLPEQDVLERYKRSTSVEPPPLKIAPPIKPQVRLSDTGVRWFSYLLIVTLASWLAWLGVEQVTTHLQAADTLPLVGTTSTQPVPIPLPPPLVPPPSKHATPEPIPPTPPLPVSQAAITSTAPVPPVTQPLPAGQAEITLVLKDDCWVDIRDADATRLAQGVLKSSAPHTFTGRSPFTVRLGKPSVVTKLLLNGEPVNPSVYQPKRGSGSRFTLHHRQTATP